MQKYKLRFYYLTGVNKGNLKYEEFFNTREELREKYNQVFEHGLKACNPTAWEKRGNEWFRLLSNEF